MKTILLLSNSLNGLILFRGELITELLKKKYKILISANKDVTRIPFHSKNLYFINTSFNRRSTRVLSNFRLFFNYLSIVIKHKPNILITYTIKPNIYGGIISRIFNLKHIATITGLGSAFEKNNLLKRLVSFLYKISFKKTNVVFFQNSYSYKLFQKLKIFAKKQLVIPGSGVNLKKFSCQTNDFVRKDIHFTFIGRIMKEKGIELFFELIELYKPKNSHINFHIVGSLEENYIDKLNKYQSLGFLKYHGSMDKLINIYKLSSAIILPSFHEGLSNVLLEASACCRPLIGSDIPGIKEIIDENVNGFLFKKGDISSFCNAIDKFLSIPIQKRRSMGMEARKKVEEKFSRSFVISKYLREIEVL